MQHFALAVAAFAAAASAYHVSIKNNCDKTAYIWSCGDTLGEMQTLEPGAEPWTEDFYGKSGGGGPSIYVSDTQDRSSGHAQFEYFFQQDVQKVWWDLSLIDGDPFSGQRVSLGSDLTPIPYDACQPVECSGVGPCTEAYLTHSQMLGTHDCPPSNLVMNLCDAGGEWNAGADHGADNDSPDVSAPAPAPEPSAPAAAPAPSPEPTQAPAAVVDNSGAVQDPVMHTAFATTIVTQVVSVDAPASQPSGVWVAEDGLIHGKRHEHGHARAHSRLFRRHSHEHQQQ